MNQNKILVLLSGGTDSTTAMYQAAKAGTKVHAITIRNRITSEKERMGADGPETYDEIMAERNVAKLNYKRSESSRVVHRIFDAEPFLSLMPPRTVLSVGGTNTSTGNGGRPPAKVRSMNCVPKGMSAAPLSQEIMLTVAASYAAANGIGEIVWAAHRDDFENEEMHQRFIAEAAAFSSYVSARAGVQISIALPFIEMRKADVMELGKGYGIDFEHDTVSCQEDHDSPCQSCPQCARRAKAEAELVSRRSVRGRTRVLREPHIPPITNVARERELSVAVSLA
jgi:7-cyano-7-deazaguanine synthase in queuosine biosynthesis